MPKIPLESGLMIFIEATATVGYINIIISVPHCNCYNLLFLLIPSRSNAHMTCAGLPGKLFGSYGDQTWKS